jgi:NADPH2:quinone reductase
VSAMSGLELRTLITSGGELRLWLEDRQAPELAADEVLIRVQATPVNPSDIGVLFGPADLSTLTNVGTIARPELVASVPASRLAGVTGRLDRPLPAGNEGAGVVVAAGTDAQSALGRGVSTQTYGMYAQYRVARLADCLVLAEGTPPRDAASAFINPLTALGMIETARSEGHTALVHTRCPTRGGQHSLHLPDRSR